MKKMMAGILAMTMISGVVSTAMAAETTVNAESMSANDLKKQQLILSIRQAQSQLEQINKELESAHNAAQIASTVNAGFKGAESVVALIGLKDALFAVVEKDKAKLSRALTKVIVGASTFIAHKSYFDDVVERKASTSETELINRRDQLKASLDQLQANLAEALNEAKK